MRVLLVALSLALTAAILLTPLAGAEWGEIGSDGWPLNVDGESVNPFPGVAADQFNALMADGDPLNQVAGVTVYPYWPLLTAEAQRLARDHPDLVKLHSAGKSTAGLDLYMLEICDFANAPALQTQAGDSCPAADGTTREVVWVDGGTHSNEYSGVYFALAWAQFLVEQYGQDDTATWIVENRHTWIMPMVNPDGSNLMGRLNAHGVNINRNYPVIWDGQGHDATLNNRGPSPASEVETQVNIEWYNLTRADYMASVHCCGNLWLYPYGEEGIDPIDNPMLQQVCAEAFAAVREDCGPIWSTIYPASGSSVDTAYEYAGMVAFGYEMSGRGAVGLWGQPLTNEAVMTQEVESWEGLEHAFLNVHRYGAYPVITSVEASGDTLQVHVRNDGMGNLSAGRIQLTSAGDIHASLASSGGAVLPFLAPGDEATVVVPREAAPAGSPSVLSVSYVKRLVATSNEGRIDVPVAFAADGATAAPDGGFLVASSGADEAAESPGLPLVMAVAALAAMAIFARRR